jgi:hypothetical protein
LLSFSGCGFKANPYYEEKKPQGDGNVEFILKAKSYENNESCK